MKPIVIGIICSMFFGSLSATPPFPPRVFSDDKFSFVVGFPWPDQEKKVLVIRTIRKTSLFSLEELGIENVGYTTAGTTWYQGAIGYVERLRTAEQAVEPSYVWAFYFRNAEGKEVVIDLAESKLIDASKALDSAFLLELNIRKAENLLGSAKPRERWTGAIHLGQLGRSACLEKLRRLLDDDSSYTQITPNQEERTVFYVKEAAEEAMRQIEARTKAD